MKTRILSIAAACLIAPAPGWARTGEASGQPAPRSIEQQLRAIPKESPVELRLQDGTKLRGWIAEVSAASVVVNVEWQGRLERREVPLADIRSVKQVSSAKPSHTGRNILIGVGIGIGAVAILIISLAKVGGYL